MQRARAVVFGACVVVGGVAACAASAAEDGVAASSQQVVYDASFNALWNDGKAEVSTYSLARQRYGEPRDGSVVVVAVTEPWSATKLVKDDDARGADRVNVLKLHTTTAFQTGVYDYHLATSAFVNLQPLPGLSPGNTIKVAFSAQEWCGQAYHEYINSGGDSFNDAHSYFADETQKTPMPVERGPLVIEDDLMLWARGLAGPALPTSTTPVTVTFQPSLERARLDHKPVTRVKATVTKVTQGSPQPAIVVDGVAPDLDRYRLAWKSDAGDNTIDVAVERAAPHRVVSINGSDGTRLTLLHSERLPYWEKHTNANAPLRQQLRLTPLSLTTSPPATPPPPAPRRP